MAQKGIFSRLSECVKLGTTLWAHRVGDSGLILLSLSCGLVIYGLLLESTSEIDRLCWLSLFLFTCGYDLLDLLQKCCSLPRPGLVYLRFLVALGVLVGLWRTRMNGSNQSYMLGIMHAVVMRQVWGKGHRNDCPKFVRWVVTLGWTAGMYKIVQSVATIVPLLLFTISPGKPKTWATARTEQQSAQTDEVASTLEYSLVEHLAFPVVIIDRDTRQAVDSNTAWKQLGHQDRYMEMLGGFTLRTGDKSLATCIHEECTKADSNVTTTCNETFVSSDVTSNRREFWTVTLWPLDRPRKQLGVALHNVTNIQAAEEAKAEEKYRSLIAYSIAHEVKTPLNGLIFHLHDLQSRGPCEQSEDVRGALASAYLLQNRLNMVNDYIQITSQQFQGERKTFVPAELLEAVRAMLLYFVPAGTSVETHVGPRTPAQIYDDRQRLETVLFHLAWNANKYTTQGTITLRIDCSEDARRLTFAVCDNGLGISPRRRKQLFRIRTKETLPPLIPRIQHRNPTAAAAAEAKADGNKLLSGLGLTICQKICLQLGTELKPESIPGRGSIFRFDLPISPLPPNPASALNASQSPAPGSGPVPVPSLAQVASLAPAASLFAGPPGVRSGASLTLNLVSTIDATSRSELPQELDLIEDETCVGRTDEFEPELKVKLPVRRLVKLMSTGRNLGARTAHPRTYTQGSMGEQLTVLVVDDCAPNRSIVQKMIRNYNSDLPVFDAANGAVAVSWARQFRTSEPTSKLLVLMDIEMPIMNGLEAAAAIREADPSSHTVIAALTAFDSPSLRQQSHDAGMNYFYLKPIRYLDLQSILCLASN